MFNLKTFLYIILFHIVSSIKYDEDILYVHLVPHSHDDVGWLHTVDQYYFRSVQYILDGITKELELNSERKFIFVETAFFKRWWNEKDADKKESVKKLIKNGQLEFINGGWCMNDEAAAHYRPIIDQMSLGHTWLYNTFGEKAIPTVGWHIDPFGHSSTMAELMAEMGFNGFFFSRIDYQDFENRCNNKTLEMIWEGSKSLNSKIFTGILSTNDPYDVSKMRMGYQPPPSFYFEQPLSDSLFFDKDLNDYNVEDRVNTFVEYAKIQASYYRTNHIMLTMGEDFAYVNAYTWFINMDRLIKAVNDRKDIHKVVALYSTPSIYVKAKNLANLQWTMKTDDFFPYADSSKSYWTGYFVSRPTKKFFAFQMSALLTMISQLDVLKNDKSIDYSILDEVVAVNYHHDGITGTEKQHVAYDYSQRLYKGYASTIPNIASTFSEFLKYENSNEFKFCLNLNESVCNATMYPFSSTSAIILYNSVAWNRNVYLTIPLNNNKYQVYDKDLNPVKFSLIENDSFDKSQLPYIHMSTYSLHFSALLPKLGYSTYYLVRSKELKSQALSYSNVNSDVTISNDYYSITFSQDSGLMTSITDKTTNITSSITQDWYWYYSWARENDQNSGAYIFRPNGTTPYRIATGKTLKTKYFESIRQTFSDWCTSKITLIYGKKEIEHQYTVGPIPIDDGVGKEVIMRISTDIHTNNLFYTDSNGREMLKRTINKRESWDYKVEQPVSGNYYPINTASYIEDDIKRLTYLIDHPMGVASLKSGDIEFMIHRRILHDDSRGVKEALNEKGPDDKGLVLRGKSLIIFGKKTVSSKLQRNAEISISNPVFPAFLSIKDIKQFKKFYKTDQSFINCEFPKNLLLLTLRKDYIEKGNILIRFAHIFGTDEDKDLSIAITIDLKQCFPWMNILNIQEKSLTTMYNIEEMDRLKWKTVDKYHRENIKLNVEVDNIKLTPMQIRTFIISTTSVNSVSPVIFYIVIGIMSFLLLFGLTIYYYRRRKSHDGSYTMINN